MLKITRNLVTGGCCLGLLALATTAVSSYGANPAEGAQDKVSRKPETQQQVAVPAELRDAKFGLSGGNPAVKDDDQARARALAARMARHLDKVGSNTRNQPLKTRPDGTLSRVVPVEFLNYSVARRNADGSLTVHHASNLPAAEKILAGDSVTSTAAGE